jgi:hypothetical protein
MIIASLLLACHFGGNCKILELRESMVTLDLRTIACSPPLNRGPHGFNTPGFLGLALPRLSTENFPLAKDDFTDLSMNIDCSALDKLIAEEPIREIKITTESTEWISQSRTHLGEIYHQEVSHFELAGGTLARWSASNRQKVLPGKLSFEGFFF